MIDTDVLRSTLEHALRNGGDFAEVFVEDRRSSSARFDDGRVEELVSGRERGAGIRVVRGDTTGLRAHRRPLAGRAARRGRGRGRRGPRRRRRCAASSRSTRAGRRPGRTRSIVLPETVEKRRKVELLARADAAARERERRDHVGHRVVRRRAPPHPGRQLRRAARRRRPGAHAVHGAVRRDRRHRHADRATRRRAARSGFELFDEIDPEDVAAARGAPRASRCSTRCPRRRGRSRSCCAAARAACCSTRRAATASRPTTSSKDASVFTGQVGEQVASPLVTLVDDGDVRTRVGNARDRRRRQARAAQRADRERRAHRLHVGPAARAQGRPAEQRQRPPPDVPAPADGAHDEHVPARRRDRSRRHRPRRRLRHLLRAARRRSGRTRRPATSCSASPRRT